MKTFGEFASIIVTLMLGHESVTRHDVLSK